jgi:starch synthase (maltosyl-transferring)
MFHANLAARLGSLWAGQPWVVSGLRVAEHQRRWHHILDRLTAPLATGSVCVSQGVLRFSVNAARLDKARLTVIPNGIDPTLVDSVEPVSRGQIHVPNDAHLALYIGRMDIQKGLTDLLDAATLVTAQQPKWHLALAGDGPIRRWLQARVASQPRLRARVHWLGHRDDVPGLLKSADVLVHPSHWEGMPNAVLEAMAARRPVVGTSVEGTEDLVMHGQTGWLVPPRDPLALSRALIDASMSPELCRKYGEAGRRRVEDEYSLKLSVTAYERLWARILGFQMPDEGACARSS